MPISNQSDTLLIVPCFNEAGRINLDAFASFLRQHPSFRILFVDDGSTDGTGQLIQNFFGRDRQADVLSLEKNVGKAEAVRHGFLDGLAEAHRPDRNIGFLDADLATPLIELVRAAEVLRRRPDLLMVAGSRMSLAGHAVQRKWSRRLLGKIFSTAASLTLGTGVRDPQCGAKLFRSSDVVYQAFAAPFRDRWLFDVEILARLKIALGQSYADGVYELPLESWQEIDGSRLRVTDFLKAPLKLAELIVHYRIARWRHSESLVIANTQSEQPTYPHIIPFPGLRPAASSPTSEATGPSASGEQNRRIAS